MQKRILLIDDESSLRRSLSLSLNQSGYDVEPCDCGLTALNKIELYHKSAVNLDSVVVDINLPDIDGIKLGKIIKSKYPEVAMMYITGYADRLELTEIDDLRSAGLLEKPFSADELIEGINHLLEQHTGIPKERSDVPEVKTTSAYILIRAQEDADYFTLYQKLYFMDNILYCDAVRGDIDIFLLIQSDSPEGCREVYDSRIRYLEGVKDSIYLPVSVPVLEDSIREIVEPAGITLFEDMPGMNRDRDSRKAVYSYVIIDIEREKLERVYPVLRLTDNVLYCDFTEGKFSIIMMVYGTQFSEIDRLIENKIVPLDGVLKVKEYPVINIFRM